MSRKNSLPHDLEGNNGQPTLAEEWEKGPAALEIVNTRSQ